MEQETHWWARCDQNGQLLFPEEYEWLLGAGGNPHPAVAPPSAWYGSWGGGMPQWHMPAWGYLPTHHQPETPVAGSLPARGTRFGPPVAGDSLPPRGTRSSPPVAGDSLPERGTSSSSKRPQDAVDEEDDLGDPMASSSDTTLQCLDELAYLLERSGRYDNRGYRASIRRQLRRYLQNRNMPLPDWLEDKGARFTVLQFRDASFDYIQSIKKQKKRRQQERVPPVPEFPDAGNSLPARGKNAELERVCKGLDDLKDELTCKPANPLPAVSGTSTPAATDVAMEEVSDTEGSELSVQLDPRKTQSSLVTKVNRRCYT